MSQSSDAFQAPRSTPAASVAIDASVEGVAAKALASLGPAGEALSVAELGVERAFLRLGELQARGASVAVEDLDGLGDVALNALARAAVDFPGRVALLASSAEQARAIEGAAREPRAKEEPMLAVAVAKSGERFVALLKAREIDALRSTQIEGVEGFERALDKARADGVSVVVSGAGWLAPSTQERIAKKAREFVDSGAGSVAIVSHSEMDAWRMAQAGAVEHVVGASCVREESPKPIGAPRKRSPS